MLIQIFAFLLAFLGGGAGVEKSAHHETETETASIHPYLRSTVSLAAADKFMKVMSHAEGKFIK